MPDLSRHWLRNPGALATPAAANVRDRRPRRPEVEDHRPPHVRSGHGVDRDHAHTSTQSRPRKLQPACGASSRESHRAGALRKNRARIGGAFAALRQERPQGANVSGSSLGISKISIPQRERSSARCRAPSVIRRPRLRRAQEVTVRIVRPHRSARSTLLAERAHAMRVCPTDTEQKLWRVLRRRGLGVEFRRQVVIAERFIVDFSLRRRGWWSRSMADTTSASGKRTRAGSASSCDSAIGWSGLT